MTRQGEAVTFSKQGKDNLKNGIYEGVSKSFRTESIRKYTLTFGITL
jgi:hypothetical protein